MSVKVVFVSHYTDEDNSLGAATQRRRLVASVGLGAACYAVRWGLSLYLRMAARFMRTARLASAALIPHGRAKHPGGIWLIEGVSERRRCYGTIWGGNASDLRSACTGAGFMLCPIRLTLATCNWSSGLACLYVPRH